MCIWFISNTKSPDQFWCSLPIIDDALLFVRLIEVTKRNHLHFQHYILMCDIATCFYTCAMNGIPLFHCYLTIARSHQYLWHAEDGYFQFTIYLTSCFPIHAIRHSNNFTLIKFILHDFVIATLMCCVLVWVHYSLRKFTVDNHAVMFGFAVTISAAWHAHLLIHIHTYNNKVKISTVRHSRFDWQSAILDT